MWALGLSDRFCFLYGFYTETVACPKFGHVIFFARFLESETEVIYAQKKERKANGI